MQDTSLPSPSFWHLTNDIDKIVSAMTLEERVHMLSGHGFYGQFLKSDRRWGGHAYKAGGGCERLGIPYLLFSDGPRGVARGNSTCFPCTMARGATFDAALEERVGEIVGIETRAQGANLSGAVCVNLLRHPAWGRAQETYGEDTVHLGIMGSAFSKGIQKHGVLATVKHFAVNSIENARFKVNVIADERTLHEVYLAHFKDILDTGCHTVMTSYNKLNGEYCGENSWLLTELLRKQWGFEGITHSDWGLGVYVPEAVEAGLDIENPEPRVFGDAMVKGVKEGRICEKAVNLACSRILKLLKRADLPYQDNSQYPASSVACQAHIDCAKEVAEKSITLIKNENSLPLDKTKIKKLAIIGSLAHHHNIGDNGSSRVRPPYVVSIALGLTKLLGHDVEIRTAFENEPEMVRDASKWADAAIVVAGYTADDEGEYIPGDISLGVLGDMVDDDEAKKNTTPPVDRGGDRSDLTLGEKQEKLIKITASANSNVVVAIVAGSAVIKENWKNDVSAILYNYYAGMEGGTALANILFGNINPSGRLPFTVPSSPDHLPFFDKDADEIKYELYAGYTYLDYHNHTPAYPFGFGLSYTEFRYSDLKASLDNGHVLMSINIENTGSVSGDEVVQFYLFPPGNEIDRQIKVLKGFSRVSLAPGRRKKVFVQIPLEKMKYWCPTSKAWKLEVGDHTFVACRDANDAHHSPHRISCTSDGHSLSLNDADTPKSRTENVENFS